MSSSPGIPTRSDELPPPGRSPFVLHGHTVFLRLPEKVRERYVRALGNPGGAWVEAMARMHTHSIPRGDAEHDRVKDSGLHGGGEW